MLTLQERAVRNTVRDVTDRWMPYLTKDEVKDIAFFILDLPHKSATATQAAIIRKLDTYHGVTEEALQTGRAIYAALYMDEDD